MLYDADLDIFYNILVFIIDIYERTSETRVSEGACQQGVQTPWESGVPLTSGSEKPDADAWGIRRRKGGGSFAFRWFFQQGPALVSAFTAFGDRDG